MNALKAVGLVVAGVALSGAALAADTSSTINTREGITPLGLRQNMSVVKATATATGSMTVDMPAPRGRDNILLRICNTNSASGVQKLLTVSDSVPIGTLTVSAGLSDTLAVGDVLRCIVVAR